MGLEAQCTARWGKQASAGQARLEEKGLYFRGNFRLTIPFGEIKSAEAKRGVLTVKFSGGTASFALGQQADRWALKIRYPRSRMEKLGVKPGLAVAVLGIEDKTFWKELRGRIRDVAAGKLRKNSDLIFYGVDDMAALKQFRPLQNSLKSAGAIWVVWRKGQKLLTENHVRAAALAAGLVDVKVCSFSETHSALKLMIPRARR